MGIFWLDDRIIFPKHEYSTEEGIIAAGGDLSIERLIFAYTNGIFPWYNDGEPIIWWSPPKRFVLFLHNFHVSRTLKKFIKHNPYKVTFDKAFDKVIQKCGDVRQDKGTWISDGMKKAYIELHKAGFAHSVEVWFGDALIGGLYGVSIGKMFAGESMFSEMNNASKVALVALVAKLEDMGFKFIDCQVYTSHLEKMGAVEVLRDKFLLELEIALKNDNDATF